VGRLCTGEASLLLLLLLPLLLLLLLLLQGLPWCA